MKVELEVSSGRPNPTWSLSPDQVEELRRRLRRLPACPSPPEPPGLGYRGFVLKSHEEADDLPRRLRVYSGVLSIGEGAGRRHLRDQSGIEDWLTAQARSRGVWPPFLP